MPLQHHTETTYNRKSSLNIDHMRATTFTCIFIASLANLAAAQSTAPPANKPLAQHMGFTENKGQIAGMNGVPASSVLFKLESQQGVYVTTSGLTHLFTKTTKPVLDEDENRQRIVQWSKVEMELKGASIKKENIETHGELPGYSNYYYPHCPEGVLFVKTWSKVIVRSVYPGIDWVLNADDKGMSHDFIVHPGADPSQIKIIYKGADALAKQGNAKLKISSAYGILFEGDLKTYTESGKSVSAKFRSRNNEVSFALGKYDNSETLVIDPPLQWAAQQISSGMDYAYAVTAPRDGSGEVCITGFTDATDFPTLNAYQGTLDANEDMIIQRLSNSGARVWSTYYGGSDYEAGKGIITDIAGNAYVAGYTGSTDFPLQNALQAVYGGGVYDAAILKFSPLGTRLWATFYGGLSTDYAFGIEADTPGNCYVTGYTNSTAFPTVSPVQATKGISYDAFVMKISTTPSVVWATYYGGDDEDKGRAITLDPSSTYIYFTGSTMAGTFPTTAGVLQPLNASGYYAEDAFITKMNASNGAVQFSTFFGGTDADFGQGIAVDLGGNAYITGYTFSSDLPVMNPGGGAYVDSTLGSIGAHDAFVMVCNSTGTSTLWSTYFGGSSSDLAYGISWDPNAGIYITGRTASTDFPLMMPADNMYYQPVHGDGGTYNDFFVSWFYHNHELQWSTFYGDGDNQEGYGISTDAGGNIFVAGFDSNDVQVLKFAPGVITGISTVSEDNFTAYPDPVTDWINAGIDVKGDQQVQARIMNMQGQQVKAYNIAITNGKNNIRIPTADLSPGIYLLEINHDQKRVQHKFVKQ